jgi:hypothetical protein
MTEVAATEGDLERADTHLGDYVPDIGWAKVNKGVDT